MRPFARHFAIAVALTLAPVAVSAMTAELPDLPRMWPLLVYEVQEDQTEIEILWPLFEIQRSPDAVAWHLLLTAYRRDDRKGETVWDFLWPIWRLWRDDEGHFRARVVPLFLGSDTKKKYAWLVPEFFWTKKSDGESWLFLLPWGRHYDHEEKYFNLLTPAYWGRDGSRRYGAVLPFTFWKSRPPRSSLIVFPEFWWIRRGRDSYTIALLPCARHQDSQNEILNVLGPVLWGRDRFFDREGERDQRYGAVLPLVFWKFDPKKKSAVVFPEFWWFHRGKGDYTFVLLPWARHRKSATEYLNVLPPVIWSRDGQQRWGTVLPLALWDVESRDDYTYILFPFFHDRKSATRSIAGILPWWIRREGERVFGNLFPVLWQTTGDELDGLVALPLLYWFRETRIVLPLFWEFGKTVLFIPVYGKGRWANWDWRTILPPGYIRWQKDDYTQHDVLWPIFSWGDGGGRRIRAARPFYLRKETPNYTLRHFLFPFVIFKDRANYILRLLLPFYQYEKKPNYTEHSFLAYLGAHGLGEYRRHDRLFPFFVSDQRRDRRYLALLWPAYRDKQAKAAHDRRLLSFIPLGLFDLAPSRDTWHVLNLLWWGRSESGRGGVRTHGLYPLYWFRDRDQGAAGSETDHRLLDVTGPWTLPPLPMFEVHTTDAGFQRLKMPLWLFRLERTPSDLSRLTVATPLAFSYRSSGAAAHDLRLFVVFWDHVHEYTRHSQGLWPFYTYKRWADRLNVSLLDPLWFWGEARRDEKHVSAFLKLFDYRAKPESLFHMLWPFYSYRRNETGGLNLSFLDPLWFWGEATGEEEHVSALFKILDYRRQPNGDSRLSFIWRAFRRDKRGDTTATEAFPFLFWEKSPGHSRFSFVWRLFQLETRDGERSLRLFFSPRIGMGKK